jgi:mono/diheme cytochrome c family protein
MRRSLPSLFLVSAVVGPALAAPMQVDFRKDVVPVLAKYCGSCHGSTKPKGGLNLAQFADEAKALQAVPVWEKVADNLRSGDMPPPGRPRPSAAELDTLNAWLDGSVFKVDCSPGKRDPGRVTVRRLNRAEYNNTIRDLIGVSFRPADDFPADDVGYGFDHIGDVLSISPLLLEKYLAAAEKIVDEAWKKPETRVRMMVGPAPTEPKPPLWTEAARRSVLPFAERAFRRPLRDDEAQRLVDLVLSALKFGDSYEVGLKQACQAVLVSPHFLFRIEADPEKPDGVRTLDEYELATRLSYFLWSTMPDEELFRLARQKELRKPGVLEAQVQRMLRDPKSRALTENFCNQWLTLRNLRTATPDPRRFPSFNEKLRDAMQRETELFFEYIVRENRSILEFLDSDYTFLNEQLAKHYGIPDVKGPEFRLVKLTDPRRGGVLTQASVLTVTSNPTRTSPVKRGKFILENVLGTPPPPPPPGVEELAEEKKGELSGTLRQKMEQHRSNAVCASCHQRMDPLGFGFENFDAIGGWRVLEEKFPIDASGELPGGLRFDGPAELRKILMGKADQFGRCFTEKLLTYALGRGLERPDRCHVEDLARKLQANGYKFTGLVIDIVKSEPFQMRRGKR